MKFDLVVVKTGHQIRFTKKKNRFSKKNKKKLNMISGLVIVKTGHQVWFAKKIVVLFSTLIGI